MELVPPVEKCDSFLLSQRVIHTANVVQDVARTRLLSQIVEHVRVLNHIQQVDVIARIIQNHARCLAELLVICLEEVKDVSHLLNREKQIKVLSHLALDGHGVYQHVCSVGTELPLAPSAVPINNRIDWEVVAAIERQ